MNPRLRLPVVVFFSLAMLASLTARRGAAQTPADSARAAMDSLSDRVERAEQAIEVLRRQLAEQRGSGVQSRSRNRVEISGLVLFNGWYNNARFDNSDVPHFVSNPQDSTGLPNANFAAAVRQSRLGLTVTGMQALGAQLSADIQMDFFGGQQPSSGGRTFPIPRIRTAFARLDWRHVGLLVGQETQIISPLNPVSFAAIGTPEFTTAGNLWFWVPQVRLGWETGSAPRFGVQAAVLAPMLGSPQTAFNTAADSAEKSRRPFLQGRVYFGWGDGETESQVGFGIHRGWIATTGDTLLASEAFTADVRLALGEKILLMGEGFLNGRATAGLGGGGIGQQFGLGGRPVKSNGAWGQINLRPSLSWEIGGGAGMDDPDDAFVTPAQRGLNVIIEGHLHYRPGGGLIIGSAFRRIETSYAAGKMAANHINAFVGVAF
jgi:hypothetical protein